MRALAGRVALLVPALLLGCAPESAAPAQDEGVALRVGGLPLTADEIERVAARLAALEPSHAPDHHRRMALTRVLFPLLAGRRMAGPERERAREEAQEYLRAWTAGEEREPEPQLLEGGWNAFGVDIWLGLAPLEPGRLSEVFEIPGAFVVARMLERSGDPRAARERLSAEIALFEYLPDRHSTEQRVYEERLEIVDPRWREIVPLEWQYKMRGGS